MRKITEESTRAFNNGYKFKKSNTEVKVSDKEVRFYLHNNCIAKKVYGDGTYLSDCGWSTNTTKDRLNGILATYTNKRIFQKDYIWYLQEGNKVKEFDSGWNKLS